MGYVAIVYCVGCGEKLKVSHAEYLQKKRFTCIDCKDEGEKLMPEAEVKEVRMVEQFLEKPAEASPKAKVYPKPPKKIPVVASTVSEFVRWLVKKRYTRREYTYLEHFSFLGSLDAKVFVVLPGARERLDWDRINQYFLDHTPVLRQD